MAITRIFRIRIFPLLRTEFEEKFADISMRSVHRADGLVSAQICKPTLWAPNEYMMISVWEDEAAVRAFAGDNWHQPVIPPGMEKFIGECWLHHYQSWSN